MHDYSILLRTELKPALGCTEPIAIALAAAYAMERCSGDLVALDVKVSKNIFKNAKSVGIPGTQLIGIRYAAALGAIGGQASLGLEVLRGLTDMAIDEATRFVDAGHVQLDVIDGVAMVYAAVEITTTAGTCKAVIANKHDELASLSVNGEIVRDALAAVDGNVEKVVQISVAKIVDYANNVPIEEIRFLMDAAIVNNDLAQEGLAHEYGLSIGRLYQEQMGAGLMGKDLKNRAVAATSAASDARMNGAPLPAYSNSGSGNQGITANIPVYHYGMEMGKSEEEILRALAVSNLMPIYIKQRLGRLSAFCGAVAAGIGASCGMTYLDDPDVEKIKYAIQNVAGDITGMFCDGAKASCALKVATAVESAFKAHLLAMHNHTVMGYEGIVEDDVDQTIYNLGLIGKDGMASTDDYIVEIMLKK